MKKEKSNPKEQNPISQMNPMTSIVNKVVLQGYKDNFQVKEDELYSLATGRHYNPEQVSIINFYRFEGQSDPADNSILYVIETSDGQKGTLVDAYGPYADVNVDKFIKEVEGIHKKMKGAA